MKRGFPFQVPAISFSWGVFRISLMLDPQLGDGKTHPAFLASKNPNRTKSVEVLEKPAPGLQATSTPPKFNIQVAPEKLPKPNRKGLSSNHHCSHFRGVPC